MTNRKLNLAVVGTGYWGPNIIRNFYENPQVDLKVICDLDKARAIQIASRYKNVDTSTQIKELAEDTSIDAVAICTPTDTHFELGKFFLQNGKHVFMEKPLAKTVKESQELKRLSDAVERVLMVGHIFLFNPAVRFIKKLLDQNELGDIIYIYAKRLNLGPIRKDVNALWDLAPHDISIFNYWLNSSPNTVNATGLSHIYPSQHDVVFCTYRYPKNIMVNLQVSWLDPKKVREIVIVGTNKMVVFDDLDPMGPIHIYDKKVTMAREASKPIADSIQAYKTIIQEGDLVVPKIAFSEPLKKECEHFVDVVLNKQPCVSSAEVGVEVVRVLEASQTSLDERGVEIPLRPSFGRPQNKPLYA